METFKSATSSLADTITTVSDTSSDTAAQLWSLSFQESLQKLRSTDGAFILSQTGPSWTEVETTMELLSRNANNALVPRCVTKIRYILKHLMSYAPALATISQCQASPLAIVWGSIELILRVWHLTHHHTR
jgi:hypothetical protein